MASVDLCHRVNPRGGLGLMAVWGGGVSYIVCMHDWGGGSYLT